MNKQIFSLIFSLLIGTGLGFANDNPILKKVNVEKSTLIWTASKVTGTHTGTVALKDGGLEFDDKGMLKGGSFEIDMTTIANTDLGDRMRGKLEGHLKSDDFFGVETHPSSFVKLKKVISRGTPGDYKVVADLTIKGITKEIKFFAKVTDQNATANITIDRSEYNVRYGSGSFFDNLGDKTIYDEFEIKVNLAL